MRVLITAEYEPQLLFQLSQQVEVTHLGWGITGMPLNSSELIHALRDKNVFVTEIELCSRVVIESSPQLSFIGTCRNNPVNVDIPAASERGIPVVYAPGRNAQAVAELTLSLMIMLARRIPNALVDVKAGKWIPTARFSYLEYKGVELAGKTAGILGFGAIGSRVASLCRAFGMTLLVYDPYLDQSQLPPDSGRITNDLHEVLRQSDFVTIHVPDTSETHGMIGKTELLLMKPSAFLINTARGKHIVETDLYEALKSKKIAGAALDVFSHEPLPLDHMFFSLDNILILPHIGGATYDVIRNHSQMMYDEIQRHMAGKPLLYQVNPEMHKDL